MTRQAPICIGLDGGGTSCRAVLVHGGRRVEQKGGPANVSDFDGALAEINAVLARIVSAAGLGDEAQDAAWVHLGLAGVMTDADAARVAAAVPFRHVTVTDDHPTMIAGALGDRSGAVVAIGTGSFVGRQAKGTIRAVGGWGWRLGDQGSGAWLGRRMLAETLLAHDGLVPESELSRRLLDRMEGGAGIVAFSLRATPADYATLAPEVTAAAAAGDDIARRLMDEGAAYIRGALNTLGWTPAEVLCLTGGVGPAYRDWLEPDVVAALRPPAGNALDGALVLARRRAGAGQ
ncbi:MAG: BadF/BadG/BcrA/BcrD ATPase family protein [Paracoccaceae bacterium]